MSKMLGKEYLNPRLLNDILAGKASPKAPVGKFKMFLEDGTAKWHTIFLATDPRTGKAIISQNGDYELNIREQTPRVEAQPLVEPESYEKTWQDK